MGARVFPRGTTVLDYWLSHAEGFTVEPLGASVEDVVTGYPSGRPEQLIVRSRTGRQREIDVDEVLAVEPKARVFLISHRSPVRLDHAAAGARAAGRGATATATWLQPRLRTAVALTVAGTRWLVPRVVAGLVLTAIVAGRLLARASRAFVVWVVRESPRAFAAASRRDRARREARRAGQPTGR
ncbi:MAG TPA: hypothetical protein VHC67_14870 [Gaiellaceae bacterium]|jgi:hypothetical protein|nr:hypothetical protein [Gaiellaceae bacterium]